MIRDAQDNSPAPGVRLSITPGNGSSATFASKEDGTYFSEFNYTKNENLSLEILETPIDSAPEVFVHYLNRNQYSREDISKAWHTLMKAPFQSLDLNVMPAARLKINYPQDLPAGVNGIIVRRVDNNMRFFVGNLSRNMIVKESPYSAVPALARLLLVVEIFRDNSSFEYFDTIKIEKFRKHTYVPRVWP